METSNKKRNKKLVITNTIVAIILYTTGVLLIGMQIEKIKEQRGLEMISIGRTVEENAVLGGISVGDKYYCIWTKNLSKEQILESTEEEKCHILIAKEPKHFCNKYIKGEETK